MSDRSCSVAWAVFFTRDRVPLEEALERAEAEDQTLLSQHLTNLLDRAVRFRAKGFKDDLLVSINAAGLGVAAQRLRPHVAPIALKYPPAAHASLAHSEPLRCLAMGRTAQNRSQYPLPQINRQRF